MRLFAFLILLIPTLAIADSIQIAWIIPEFNQDGSVLSAADIDGYKVKHWLNNERQSDIDIVGGLSNEHILTEALPGYHVFQVAATVDGAQGDYTDPYVLPLGIIPPQLPSAPSMSVQLVCTEENCVLEVK